MLCPNLKRFLGHQKGHRFRILPDLIHQLREEARYGLARRFVRALTTDEHFRKLDDETHHLDPDARGVAGREDERGVVRCKPDSPESQSQLAGRQATEPEFALLVGEKLPALGQDPDRGVFERSAAVLEDYLTDDNRLCPPRRKRGAQQRDSEVAHD
jgi:hypothetical protein